MKATKEKKFMVIVNTLVGYPKMIIDRLWKYKIRVNMIDDGLWNSICFRFVFYQPEGFRYFVFCPAL